MITKLENIVTIKLPYCIRSIREVATLKSKSILGLQYDLTLCITTKLAIPMH